MIFSLLSFTGGAGLLFLLYRRHAKEIAVLSSDAHVRPYTFAALMRLLAQMCAEAWSQQGYPWLIKFVDRRVRWTRIVVLKLERVLLNASHRLRNSSLDQLSDPSDRQDSSDRTQ